MNGNAQTVKSAAEDVLVILPVRNVVLFPGVVLMFVFYLFYSWQGYAQFGSRYMQDIYPFLLPVAFSAFARPVPLLRRLLYVLVGASIAINLYGLYCATQYP